MPPSRSSQRQLFDAVAGDGASSRRALAGATLRAMVDLLCARIARCAEAVSVATEIALAAELAPLADEAAAMLAARRIIGCGDQGAAALQPVSEALFARGGGAAVLLLKHAAHAPDPWRERAMLTDDPRLAAALAARSDLAEAEQQGLIERGETAVLISLARNARLALSRSALQHLIANAQQDVAQALLSRTDLDAATLLPLYRFADAGRRMMLREAVAERIALRGLSLKDHAASEAEVEGLLDAAMQGMAALIVAVGRLAARGQRFVEAMRVDRDRDLLALALVALDIAPEIATRLLLRSGDPLALDSRRMLATVEVLRRTPRSAAVAILAAQWPKEQTGAKADPAARPAAPNGHQPAMAPGGSAARETTPGRQPAPTPNRRRGAAGAVDELKARR
jgi:hypothetical protein